MPVGVYVRSEEHKRKMREVLKPTQFKAGVSAWNKGKKYQIGQGKYVRTEEIRQKMSDSLQGRKSWNKGVYGPKSHSWKHGGTGLTERIRNTSPYKQWRADVFKRDGWTCQTCGLRGHGNDIEAHHIVPVKELLKQVHIDGVSAEDRFLLAMQIPKMFDVSNGATLCKDCHILTFHKRRTK